MSRKFKESCLVIASHNQGKIKEIEILFKPLNIDVTSAAALNLPEPLETGTTYLENALIKARAGMNATGLPVLSDDSGLEVEALGNKPGVYTAPFTEKQGGHEIVFKQWAQDPKIQSNPKAAFCCVIVLLWPDHHYEVFERQVNGILTFPPRGNSGHGFDPIFIPDGYTKTNAEMSLVEKNQCSHRFLAIKQCIKKCF